MILFKYFTIFYVDDKVYSFSLFLILAYLNSLYPVSMVVFLLRIPFFVFHFTSWSNVAYCTVVGDYINIMKTASYLSFNCQ